MTVAALIVVAIVACTVAVFAFAGWSLRRMEADEDAEALDIGAIQWRVFPRRYSRSTDDWLTATVDDRPDTTQPRHGDATWLAFARARQGQE